MGAAAVGGVAVAGVRGPVVGSAMGRRAEVNVGMQSMSCSLPALKLVACGAPLTLGCSTGVDVTASPALVPSTPALPAWPDSPTPADWVLSADFGVDCSGDCAAVDGGRHSGRTSGELTTDNTAAVSAASEPAASAVGP